MKVNRFSKSFGLIVIVDKKDVVVIQRTIPYVMLQYEMYHKSPTHDDFIFNYLPRQKTDIKLDYRRFLSGFSFEDEYDFPHGQKEKKETNAFEIAFREFEEETGYTFDCPNTIPEPKTVEFTGLDGFYYKQDYYILHVKSLKKCEMKDGIYIAHLMDIEKAKKVFYDQQLIKRDDKHLLLL